MRVCSRCLVEKPEEDFYLHKGKRTSPGYRNPSCKTCQNKASSEWAKNNPEAVKRFRRKSKLKEKYSISEDDFNYLLSKQNYRCYICNIVPTRDRHLNVDHCHTTGKVRKLLCDKCNMALGLVNDSKETLLKMFNYLEEHQN